MPAAQLASQVNNKNMQEQKQIKCPKCQDGTLELLNEKELAKLKALNKGDKLPDQILGCDECRYWIDEEDAEFV